MCCLMVLGLLLAIAAGVFAAGVVASNTAHVHAEAFGVSLSNVSVGGLFLAGAVTALVFALGLFLLLGGAARARRRRVERRRIVRDSTAQASTLTAEKERLERELEEERARRSASTASRPPEGSGRVLRPEESATGSDVPAEEERGGFFRR